MSSIARPSGPLSPRVYWTRRLLLLVIVALLAWGVLRWVGDPGPSAADDAAAPVTTEPASTPPSSPAAVHDRRPRVEPTAGVRLVSAHFDAAESGCEAAAVRVVPEVRAPALVGEPVQLHLRVTTTSERSCTLDLDAASLLVAITAGEEPVWSSSRCPSAMPSSSLVVRPHWSSVVEVVWSGHLGRVGCDTTAPAAPAGFYTVQAALVEGEPGTTDFELEMPRDPAPRAPNGSRDDRAGDPSGRRATPQT